MNAAELFAPPRRSSVPLASRFDLGRIRLALSVLALIVGVSSSARASQRLDANAPASPSQFQIFVQLDGTVLGWTQLNLTAAHVQVDGQDAAGRQYSAALFDGVQSLTIPRASIGSPRLLVGGSLPAGTVSQVTVVFNAIGLTTDPAGQSTTPRTIAPQLGDNTRRLQFIRPLTTDPGGTTSLDVTLVLGSNVVVGKNGYVQLSPVLSAHAFTPAPENYINGNEIVTRGIDEDFPELGLRALRSKILDPVTGDVRDLTLRDDNGGPAAFTDLRHENEQLWRQHHGALSPALADKLSGLAGGDEVLADLFLRVPGAGSFITDATTPETWDLAHNVWVAQRHSAALPVANAVAATLTAAGATVLSTELSPPVLHVRATRNVLQTVASHIADVIEIHETPPVPKILATNGAIDLGQEPLWLAHLLLAGQGLRIAICEPQACINKVHEAFRNITVEDPVAFPCTETTGNSGHSTAVASAAGAAVGPDGSIKLVGLFQGHMLTSDNGGISDAVLQRNPHLINLSFEIAESDRKALDYAVYSDRVFVANGSGNVEAGEDPATLPVFGYSYNSLCVGGYNHHETLGPENYGDDTVAGRYVNDPVTHREKPDLVGPYSGYYASWDPTKPHQYDPWGGTSFSTPMVVGTAALLMANFPQELTSNPTLTRAVLMTSARHAIEGNPPIPIIADGSDDKSGAGAPRGDRAKKILDDGDFFSKFVDQATDFDVKGFLNVPIEIHSNPGDKVRVVMTYDQCQDDVTSIPDALLADLDMTVTEGYLTGSTFSTDVHVNNSHVDNTEMVEFVSRDGITGITVKVRAQHWDACTDGSHQTHLAIAWDVMHPGELAANKFDNAALTQRLVDQSKALSTLQFRSVTPNPFAGSLRFQYEVPAVGGPVSIRVYDLAGRLVAQPVSGPHKGGIYNSQWNATGRDGHRLAPGVYMVQLQMGPKSVMRRVILTR